MEAKPVLAFSAALVIGAASGYVAGIRSQPPSGTPPGVTNAVAPAPQRPDVGTTNAGPTSNAHHGTVATLSGDWAADLHAAVALFPATARADRIRELAAGCPTVRMLGWVPSVVPYLERVRVSLLPLLHGAGTKRKLIQSLAIGTPAPWDFQPHVDASRSYIRNHMDLDDLEARARFPRART